MQLEYLNRDDQILPGNDDAAASDHDNDDG